MIYSNKKYLGENSGWNDDFSINVKLEDEGMIVKEATQSFSVPFGDDTKPYKPEIGSSPTHSELIEDLKLRSYEISNNGAYFVTKCRWQTPESESEDSSGDDSGDEEEDPQDYNDDYWKIGGKRHNLHITQTTEIMEFNIMNHPKYAKKKWGAKDILILTEWMNGGVDKYDYTIKGTPIDCGKSGIRPDNPDDTYLIMKEGVKSWKCPIITYTVKYETKRIPRNPFKYLGHIAFCKGVKMKDKITVDGQKYPTNYLLSSVAINKMERYKYSITLQYRQAPPGGWDERLYNLKYKEPLSNPKQ